MGASCEEWGIGTGSKALTGLFFVRILATSVCAIDCTRIRHADAHRLRELLQYDLATGVFTWLVNCGRMAKAGGMWQGRHWVRMRSR